MAFELSQSEFLRTVRRLVEDGSDLVRKEIALARAEVMAKISERVQAAVWFAVAGVLGLMVLLLVLETIVFALVAAGLPPWAACLCVAVAAAILALCAFGYGRSEMRSELAPTRSMAQINEDVRTVKEQLS
jgi:hypothetical protein